MLNRLESRQVIQLLHIFIFQAGDPGKELGIYLNGPSSGRDVQRESKNKMPNCSE